MTIKQWCEPWQHQFIWRDERAGVSQWVCSKCGEVREQNEDLGSGG